MRRTGFRLWTILIIIAILAVLMGLGATMRRGLPFQSPTGGFLEFTRRAEILIWTGQDVDPDGGIEETYLLVPLEYLFATIVILGAPIVLAVKYLSVRRKRAERLDNPIGPRTNVTPTECQTGPDESGGLKGSVG